MKPPPSRLPDLVLLAVAIAWGSSYLAAKDATALAPVLVVLALRYAISLAGLVLLRPRRRPGRPELRAGAVLGGTQAAVLVLETFGVAHTSATNAGLIISLTVVLTPVLDSAWRRAWLPPAFFVAAAAAVVGVGLLVSGHGFRAPTWGDALMLAAAVVRAVHVVLIGRLTRGRDLDTVALTVVQLAVGCAGIGLAALPQLPAQVPALGAAAWLRLGYLALVCSVFAFLAQTWAIRRTSPSRASLLMGTEPLWAAVVGVGVGGERLTLLSAVGGFVIVAATSTGQRVERRHAVPLAYRESFPSSRGCDDRGEKDGEAAKPPRRAPAQHGRHGHHVRDDEERAHPPRPVGAAQVRPGGPTLGRLPRGAMRRQP